MRDGFFVLVVCGPDGYFVPLGAHVNDGSAHVIAVVIKGFAHQTQKLREEQQPSQSSRLLERKAQGGQCYFFLEAVNI